MNETEYNHTLNRLIILSDLFLDLQKDLEAIVFRLKALEEDVEHVKKYTQGD